MNKLLSVRNLALLLAMLTFAGCATQKINWAARVGTYTFDQAVMEFGPPDKQAKLADGTLVAEWQTQRGYTRTEYVPYYYGYRHRYGYGYYGPPMVTSLPDVFLRLTFDPQGKLITWKKVVL